MTLSIQHNQAASRFEYQENGLLCHIDYRINDQIMTISHTSVPSELGGKGIAGALTEFALAYAKENQLKVKPLCSYTATYFKRHSEHADLLA